MESQALRRGFGEAHIFVYAVDDNLIVIVGKFQMKRLVLFLGVFCLAVQTNAAHSQDDWFKDIVVETEDLGNGIYMMSAGGGNIGVSVGTDGVFMIDDAYGEISDKVLAALAEITDQPVSYLINTHWHGDHVGANEAFNEHGALIFAHENVRSRMKDGLEQGVFGQVIEPASADALPVITFSEDTRFHINGMEMYVFHVEPSHTDGDSIAEFVGANIVHMGDTFFHAWYPLIDHVSGGSLDGMINVQSQILEKVDEHTKIIPGHGPLANKAGLAASRDGLVAVRDVLVPLAASDQSLEDIVAAKPLAPLNLGWGGF